MANTPMTLSSPLGRTHSDQGCRVFYGIITPYVTESFPLWWKNLDNSRLQPSLRWLLAAPPAVAHLLSTGPGTGTAGFEEFPEEAA